MINYLDKIKVFIEQEGRAFYKDISRETRLQEDLKIYGDDAVEFILSFAKEFNVDVSAFHVDEYFSPEGLDIFSSFIELLGISSHEKRKVLTVGDLEEAVISKKL